MKQNLPNQGMQALVLVLLLTSLEKTSPVDPQETSLARLLQVPSMERNLAASAPEQSGTWRHAVTFTGVAAPITSHG